MNFKMIVLLFMILMFSSPAFAAVAKDMRISDNDGDVLAISSGTITITTTNTAGTASASTARDSRISDNDGDILSINSDGSVNAVWT